MIDYAECNREAWNQVAPIHQKYHPELKNAVQAESFSVLDDIEKAIFEKISVKGKTVAQFCCNNGRELISVVKMGAASGVGFDIADEFIQEAQMLASLARVNCDFVRTNIYDISEAYFNRFDIVYITIGALAWFEDLQRFFQVVANVLSPNGYLVIYEMHPCPNMLAIQSDSVYDKDNELKIVFSYFKKDPWVDNGGLDYYGGTQYEAKTNYSFSHTFADILNGISSNNMALLELQEYAHDISMSFKHVEKYQKLPLSYSLVARKMETLITY